MHPCAPFAYGDERVEHPYRRITLSSGLTLNAFEWRPSRPASGMPTLLLLHGLGDATCVWRDVAVGLQAHARMIAVDLRGHGDSDWPTDADYHVLSMAKDIGELMRLLGPEKLTVVGHSMGAAVALRLVADRPQQFERLVLADFGLKADLKSVMQLRSALRDAHRTYASVGDYETVLRARHPLAQPNLMEWVATQTSRLSPAGVVELKYDPRILTDRDRAMGTTMSAGMYQENCRLLASLSCPVMVLRGIASSVLSVRDAHEMVGMVSNGIFCSIPLAGHSIHLDNPGAVASAIKEFLRLPTPESHSSASLV
jgi:pimeloyl-ACP methyl ester carboxylesterase